ncbi:hypothetical protein GWK47_025129 [Chionoecetes opilio]|uniref:Uncharacterized protein n=1 Tax=Chionoecetes opilio TaxID=41210 RepID=A0A8J4XLB7_CHIOP|nr:hypothetical protein GWK47_025129 [Chionoecetes opilio]
MVSMGDRGGKSRTVLQSPLRHSSAFESTNSSCVGDSGHHQHHHHHHHQSSLVPLPVRMEQRFLAKRWRGAVWVWRGAEWVWRGAVWRGNACFAAAVSPHRLSIAGNPTFPGFLTINSPLSHLSNQLLSLRHVVEGRDRTLPHSLVERLPLQTRLKYFLSHRRLLSFLPLISLSRSHHLPKFSLPSRHFLPPDGHPFPVEVKKWCLRASQPGGRDESAGSKAGRRTDQTC